MHETGEAMLDMRDLAFSWPGSRFGLTVPAFSVAKGETLFLNGPSGSGKSTLLSLICGIVTPHSGSIAVNGVESTALRQSARDRLRAETIGVIFQLFNLVPYLTAVDNILLPLRFAPERKATCPDPGAEALRLAGELGLPETILRSKAASLSVGQQQRVAVARALIGNPPLIIADEPTSALDAKAQTVFLDLLFEQVAAAGATLLMVSHDDRLATRFDRLVVLSDIATTTEATP